MLFNSYAFVFFFLPLTLFLYFGCNYKNQYQLGKIILLIASFVFYGYGNYKLCALIGVSILFNYLIHVLIVLCKQSCVWEKVFVATGILANTALIGYYKYFDFVFHNLDRIFKFGFVEKNILLPLGISFYTFQQISFLVDSMGADKKKVDFLDYALYISFFPQLVAGPITLHGEMVPQFNDVTKKQLCWNNILDGIEYFILGLAKKMLIADYFARLCDAGFARIGELNTISALITMVAFTLEIYFDFSGYCDIAIGVGCMFNISIPINFYSPYKALSIGEFWKRWHKTLTRFLTTYVYIPLGGSRVNICRTCLNIFIVFLVSGIWHGAGWTFILWGVLHGIAMILYRISGKMWDRLPGMVRWLATFAFVNVAWIFFRAEHMKQALQFVGRFVWWGDGTVHQEIVTSFYERTILDELIGGMNMSVDAFVMGSLCVVLWTCFWIFVCKCSPSSHEMVVKKNKSNRYYVLLGIVVSCCIILMSGTSKFIYFNF